MLRDNQQLSLKSLKTIIGPETFYPLAHPHSPPLLCCYPFLAARGKNAARVCITTERQEVQLGRLAAHLINAAFILPRWDNMGAVQGDHWYLMVLVFLPFLKGKVLI